MSAYRLRDMRVPAAPQWLPVQGGYMLPQTYSFDAGTYMTLSMRPTVDGSRSLNLGDWEPVEMSEFIGASIAQKALEG